MDCGAKQALAAVSSVALEAAAQGTEGSGEAASTGVPEVQDLSRMGERSNHKGEALMGLGVGGMYGSLSAQQLMQQLQLKAPGTFQSRGPTRAHILHRRSPATPQRDATGCRWPARAALGCRNQGNRSCLGGVITLDQGVRSLCEREGGVQGPALSCHNQPQMWPLKCVLRGPQCASLQ